MLSQPFALLVHVVLVPPDATATPGIVRFAYWMMTAVWSYGVLVKMWQLESPLEAAAAQDATMLITIDMCRGALIALLTCVHGCLLQTQRVRPWTAFRNLAGMAPTITGGCMLASLCRRSGEDVVYAPNGTPLAVALLRMASCYCVCVLSCMPQALQPPRPSGSFSV